MGDLFQLPPVGDEYVFKAPVWQAFECRHLETSFRQANDEHFYNILRQIRERSLDETNHRILHNIYQRDRQIASLIPQDVTSSTILHSRKYLGNHAC